MTPETAADQLVAHFEQNGRIQSVAALEKHLSMGVVRILLDRMGAEYMRNAQRALELVEIAEAVAHIIADPEAIALATWGKGGALQLLNRYREAVNCYQDAEKFFASQDNQLRVVSLQVNQVGLLRDMGEYENAILLADKARAICEAIGKAAQRSLANLEMNVAWAYQRTGDIDAALQAYDRTGTIFTALGDSIQKARTDLNRAIVLEEIGQFSEAAKKMVQARAVLSEHDQYQEVARADLNLGVLAYRRGYYQEALKHLEMAHQGFAQIPNMNQVANVDLYRSFVYRDLNLLPETINLAAAAEKILKQEKQRWEQALALINQGIGYKKLGKLTMAEKLLAKARRILRGIGAEPSILMLDVERASLALARGYPKTARRIALRVERRIGEQKRPLLQARVHLLLGQCALVKTLPFKTQAIERYMAAHQIAAAYGLHDIAIQAHQLSAQIAERGGDLAEEQEHLHKAAKEIEYLRRHILMDELQIGFMDDKLAIYQQLVCLSHKMKADDPQALSKILRYLHQAYPAPITHPANSKKVEASSKLAQLREQWRWFQSQFDSPYHLDSEPAAQELLADPTEFHQKMAEIEAEIAELSRRSLVQNVSTTEENKKDNFAKYIGGGEPSTNLIADIQLKLSSQDALLQYYVVDDQLQALLITQDDVHQFEDLIQLSNLNRLVQVWRFHIEHVAADDSDMVNMAAIYLERLYHALMQPMTSFIPQCEHIFLVMPPEWLHLPFAALFNGRFYLIEQFDLTYLSTAVSLLNHDAASLPVYHSGNMGQALIVGHSDNGRLSHIMPEINAVTWAVAPRWAVTLLTETSATIRQISEHSRASRLIHLAAHATFRPDNPLFSWIRLENGRLTVADLYEMYFPKRPLVILSACETGRGQPRGGGLLGLSRGFQAAGAGGLIVSQWQVEDEASAQLMIGFYEKLGRDKIGIAKSLGEAQRQAIKKGQHPIYWAAFIYIQS